MSRSAEQFPLPVMPWEADPHDSSCREKNVPPTPSGFQKGSLEVARGSQATDQIAKTAALQNNNLIGVATLVPQTNLSETPSYTEGETLKTKNEGF